VGISGYVVLGIVTLFLVYLVPQLIRSRQDVLDSRLTDRFSADLRILATAGASGSEARPTIEDAPRVYLLDPRLRTDVSAMNRPTSLASPTSASAPVHTDAGARRRRAAARRRLLLTLVLFLLSAAAWSAVASGTAQPGLAVVPTALLLLVLVVGRRAAAASRAARSSTARAQAVAPAAPTVGVPGGRRSARRGQAVDEPARGATPRIARGVATSAASRTVASGPRDAQTEIIPRLRAAEVPVSASSRASRAGAVADRAGSSALVTDATGSATSGTIDQGRPTPPVPSAPAEAAQPVDTADTERESGAAVSSRSWTPVPVPVPTYTLKPAAPRTSRTSFASDPAPAPVASAPPAVEAEEDSAAEPPLAAASENVDPRQGASDSDTEEASRVATSASSPHLDLDAVLMRRRASGE
jgi:hypothetical protein